MFIARDPLGAVRLAAKGMQPSRRAPFDCSTGLDHVQELRPEKVEVLSHRLESHDKDLAERTLSKATENIREHVSLDLSQRRFRHFNTKMPLWRSVAETALWSVQSGFCKKPSELELMTRATADKSALA